MRLITATIPIIHTATTGDRLNRAKICRAGQNTMTNSVNAGISMPIISCHSRIFLYERWYLPVMNPKKIQSIIMAMNSHTYTRIADLSAAIRHRMHNRPEITQISTSVHMREKTDLASIV